MKHAMLRLLGLAYGLFKHTPLIHFSLAKRLYYRVYAWSRPRDLTQIQISGNRLWLDPRDQGIASFLLTRGCYEPFEVSIVQRLLRPGACFVDIGANIGLYSVIAAQAVGATGRVHAFEPGPRNFELLQRNIALNNFKDRVTAQEWAIGAESGSCKLYLCEDNLGDHRIVTESNDGRTAIDVPLRTLDEAIDPKVSVDLIKVDIQGAELLALLGMQRLLSDNFDLAIVAEFWPDGIRRSGHDPLELVNHLYERRFVAYLIDEQRQRLSNLSQDELRRRCPAKQQCNLLWARGACLRQVAGLQ